MKIKSRYHEAGGYAAVLGAGFAAAAAALVLFSSASFPIAQADESLASQVRFDAAGAKASGNTLAGGDTRQLDVKVEGQGGNHVAIVVPGFRFGPFEGPGLTARAMVRAAIPVEIPPGRYPAGLSARLPIALSKESGVSFGVGLRATLLALPIDVVNVSRAREVGISAEVITVEQIQAYAIGDDAVRVRFCGGAPSDGLLTVDLALSAERENTSINMLARPAEGADLRIVVSAAGTLPCP